MRMQKEKENTVQCNRTINRNTKRNELEQRFNKLFYLSALIQQQKLVL